MSKNLKINLSSKKVEGCLSKDEFNELLRNQKTYLKHSLAVNYEVDLKKNQLSGDLDMLSILVENSEKNSTGENYSKNSDYSKILKLNIGQNLYTTITRRFRSFVLFR